MNMSPAAFAFVGLTALVAMLVAILAFAVLRFGAAAKDSRRLLRENNTERAFVTAALHEALTKLKTQERELTSRAEASERLSSEIVESLTAGLLVVDNDGNVKILNPSGRRMLHLPELTEGQNYTLVLKDVAPLIDVITACLATGEPIVRRQLDIGAGLPPVTHLGVSLSALSDGHGNKHGIICLFTDLTPVIEMEEQLRLKESLAKVGELTAGIAHEFRNGLATIHGYARLLDLKVLPQPFHPHVNGIRKETEALGEVVTNFLNFAKPAQMTLLPVDLRTIAERAAEEVKNDVKSRGGDITVNGDFPVIEGDDVLLRQAFSNLMRNAIEACSGASIQPQITIEGHLEPGHVRVSIDDNGPGIPATQRERIFQPFYTTKGRGTGLGLALVQKIIVTHNGRIQVGAAQNGGASMQVLLPIAISK